MKEDKNITADIIADSVNSLGHRLTTFVVVVPRIVLAEFNTHRALSRNSASSRAIPFSKMVEKAKTNPFIPRAWQKDHKGMQGTKYFSELDTIAGEKMFNFKTNEYDLPIYSVELFEEEWLTSRDYAVNQATTLNNRGVTKQICNRLLEPFMYQTIIVTATEWENFFALRADPAAEIHIQELAFKMLEAYNKSTPVPLKKGEWHIPFGDRVDAGKVTQLLESQDNINPSDHDVDQTRIKIATARCARVSYLNFEGKDDYQADIKLHDNLASMGHWSPFEHCAENTEDSNWSGNFRGFKQYRKSFQGENKTDERVKSRL